MKYFAPHLCALFALACFFSPARAQSKIGYIDFQLLIVVMSESSAASTRVASLQQSLSNQIESKTVTLQEDKFPLDDPASFAERRGI